jgi:hypothetical protein
MGDSSSNPVMWMGRGFGIGEHFSPALQTVDQPS